MPRNIAHRFCGITTALTAWLAGPSVPAHAQQELTAAFNGTGQRLFSGMLRDAPDDGNIVFSPYSVGSAMAMALAGARGPTEREMAGVLGLGLARASVAAQSAAVAAILNGYDQGPVAPTCPAGLALAQGACVGPASAAGRCPPGSWRDGDGCGAAPVWPRSAQLRTANALMIGRQADDAIADDYAALLAGKFGAEVFCQASVDVVNDWVNRRTEGKIDRLLDRLNPAITAVILNAIYFKVAWQTPFRKEATRPSDFNLSVSHKAQVPTMHQLSAFAVSAGAGYRAVRLPYNVAPLSMTLVLPDRIDGLADTASRLTASALADLMAALRRARPRPVVLSLPRFKVDFRASLVDGFRRLGMTRAFDLAQADFSGMTGQPPDRLPTAVQDIVHRAVIEVAEEGTEAAAATAVMMARAARPASPEPFAVDRPFLFFITDDATGAILFQGRIVDPR